MDVFVHVPKSSGSTVRSILSRQYGVEHIVYYEANSPYVDKTATPNTEIMYRDVNLITGHEPFGVHETLRLPCNYFTILRDPIRRALSDYYYAYSYERHRFRNEILSGSLTAERFLTEPMFGNLGTQIALLSGSSRSLNELTAAIENVDHCFAAVGVAERFDESILYFAKTLGWRPPIYINRNVSKLPDSIREARQQTEQEIILRHENLFRNEYRLYSHVIGQLDSRIQAQGSAFSKALDAFCEIQGDIAKLAQSEVYELYELHNTDALPEFAARYIDSQPYRVVDDYLRDSPLVSGEFHNYDGHVERKDGNRIAGWAIDLCSHQPIEVAIFKGREEVARTMADRPRDDVLANGYQRAEVGFLLTLDYEMENPADYQVCFGSTKLQLR